MSVGMLYDNAFLDCESSYFEDNGSSKIGVRFDKQIPDGNDLGGMCEEDHGFFCSG